MASRTTAMAAFGAGLAVGAAGALLAKKRADARRNRDEMSRLYALRPSDERRVTVAVDVDEVLAHFLPALIEYHNTEHGTELELSDFHSYRFSDVWGGSSEETIRKVHHFFESVWFHEMPVVRGARATLERHMDSFNYVVVTSRQHSIERQTRLWLQRNFPGLFSDILFGNHYGLTGKKRSKPELCRSVGAQLLIDDNISYARECAASGMRVIMFDWDRQYRYSAYDPDEDPLPDTVLHVHSWGAVGEELGRFAGERGV